MAGVSRRRAQRLIGDGMVTVNGRVAAAGDKGRAVGPGDVVAVAAGVGLVVPEPPPEVPPEVPPEIPPESSHGPLSESPPGSSSRLVLGGLVELARGAGWVAVDKPAGRPVHPLHEGETGTVLNAVAARYPEVQGVGHSGGEGGLKSGVVHRLDVETSGVVLVALDEARWRAFREAFAGHRAGKTYTALVAGRPRGDGGRLDLRLGVRQHKPARVGVIERGDPAWERGRSCRLSWRIKRRLPGVSRVEVELETGFLHQIRVSFAHLGHPVLGDPVYGPAGGGREPRLMLHASRLRLGEEIDVHSPLPEAFTAAMARYKRAGSDG